MSPHHLSPPLSTYLPSDIDPDFTIYTGDTPEKTWLTHHFSWLCQLQALKEHNIPIC